MDLTPIEQIRHALTQLDLADLEKRRVGVNRCQRVQRLTRMSINAATVMLPVQGEKQIQVSGTRYAAQAGEMLLLPPGVEVDIQNLPDSHAHRFESVLLVFDEDTLDLFLSLIHI